MNTVQNGGLKVYTTIQPRLQEAAQSAVDACSVCYPGGGPASALASVDPSTGEIVALASSQRYSRDSQFNFAAQAHRQPGSSFKAFVLTTAIKQGIDPDSTYYDGTSPKTLEIPGGSSWTVNNAEPGSGTMSLTQATGDSVNASSPSSGSTSARQLRRDRLLDGDHLAARRQRLTDIPCKLGPHCYIPPADAIGGLSDGVTPLEMADAYATLADGGVHHDPTAIDRVVFPDGNVGRAGAERGQAGAHRRRGLRGHQGPRGRDHQRHRRRLHPIGCQSEAGKTGTTDGLSDAWFVGYTPNYSTAVWTGHPLSRTYTGFGGPTSGPIWRSYMEAAQGSDCPDFVVPTTLPTLTAFHGKHTSGGSSSSYGIRPRPRPRPRRRAPTRRRPTRRPPNRRRQAARSGGSLAVLPLVLLLGG